MPEASKELRKNLAGFIGGHREEMLGDIVRLIDVPSVTSDRKAAAKAVSLVLERAREFGFRAFSACGGEIGVAELGEGTETVGVVAHVDVVPPGEESLWHTPPFRGVLDREGFVRGRGAVDDKGPLVASLYAMKAVAGCGAALRRKIRLIIGTREETVWTDIARYSAEYPAPDFGFTPDGEFPVTNIEKGNADIRLLFEREACEKEAPELLRLSGGTAQNVVPDKASAVVRCSPGLLEKKWHAFLARPEEKWLACEPAGDAFRITARGRSVHSSTPESGVNSILNLCAFLHTLGVGGAGGRLAAFADECLSGGCCGERLGLPQAGEYFGGEYVHRTVVSPVLLEGEAGRFELSLNFRISYPRPRSEIENVLRRRAAEYGFTCRTEEYGEPLYVPKQSPFLQILANSYRAYTGEENAFSLACGMSYAHAFPNMVSFGPLFPGEEDTCHAPNERISVKTLQRAAEIYACALAGLASEKAPLAPFPGGST